MKRSNQSERGARSTVPVALLMILLVGAITGCPGDPGASSDGVRVLQVGLESDPTNLDPRRATDAASSRILDLVVEGLLALDASGSPVPALATHWDRPDDRTYVFHLAPDVVFHDGSTFDAEDVIATYETMLDPAFASPHRGAFDRLESIEADGPTRVVVRLSETFAPLLTAFTRGILPSEQARAVGSEASQAPIGTGPYRVVEVASGERVVLEISPHARGEAPTIGRMLFRVITDETTRRLELRKGSLDFVLNGIDPEQVDAIEADARFRVLRTSSANSSYLGFNHRDEALRDVRVRRAIAHAIDRESIIEHLLDGRARLATGLLPPTNWAFDAAVTTYGHDPERARALLDEAGLTDPDGDGPKMRLTLVHKTSENRLRQRIAQVLQSQLAEVGIGLQISASEWGTFFEDVKRGNFQTYTLSWVGLTEPDIFHTVFHSSNAPPEGANRGRYENPELDELTDRARGTLDREERRQLYAEIQRITADDLPYVFLWHEQHVAILNADLEGFELTPTGQLDSLAHARWRDPVSNPG